MAGRTLAERRANLEARARILHAVRAFFASEGFLEVETPTRVRNPGQELHLDAFPAGGDRFLITSPEHHMKRLVGAGLGRIVQVTRAFRAEEAGPHHQPEFTMIEWYRPGEPLEALMRDCERLLAVAATAAGQGTRVPVPANRAREPGETIDLAAPAERVSVRALLERHADVRIAGDESVDELRAALVRAGHDPRDATTFDDLFFQVFLDHVEPHLGRGRPTIVHDWPLPLAALARRRPDNPAVAERFELYAAGLELANAFGELTDADEQRARFVAEAAERRRRGKVVYPIDEPLLVALAHMPPTSGIALGFDRLVMLALGASELREVVAFSNDEV